MASTVISAAVAARQNNQPSILSPILVNPFKRRRRTLDDEPLADETSLGQSEDPEERAVGDPRQHVPDYGSVVQPRVAGEPDHAPSRSSRFPKLTPLQTSSGLPEGRDDMENIGATSGERDIDAFYEAELDAFDEESHPILTRTSYRRLIRLFSFVPITALLTMIFFILLRRVLWPAQTMSSFASYSGLVILGAAVWTVSFALRIPVYLVSSLVCHAMPIFTPFVSASLQVFVEELLRLSSLILAHIHIRDSLNPGDPSFSQVWTLALGWAAAEVAVSVSQGYAQLALYSDVVFSDDSMLFRTTTPSPFEEQSAMPDTAARRHLHDPEQVINEEIDQIIRIRARTELEALYGIPVPDIPVFVSCLLRIDSITLSLALFLIISSSYLSFLFQSPLAEHRLSQAIRDTFPTFIIIFVLRTILSFSWTLNVLPRIGLHAASYMSCIFALGSFFMGLGRWDAI